MPCVGISRFYLRNVFALISRAGGAGAQAPDKIKAGQLKGLPGFAASAYSARNDELCGIMYDPGSGMTCIRHRIMPLKTAASIKK